MTSVAVNALNIITISETGILFREKNNAADDIFSLVSVHDLLRTISKSALFYITYNIQVLLCEDFKAGVSIILPILAR